MSAFYVYFLLSAIIPIQFATASTPDDFWREYQTAKQTKTVKNLVDHVQTLSVRLDTDTGARLEQKKSAILYFMATGGKNGFRKTSATPAEKKVMENALIFATILNKIKGNNKTLVIMDVRREADITAEDSKIKRHLIKAQGIITATQIMSPTKAEERLASRIHDPFRATQIISPKSSEERLGSRIHALFNEEYMRDVISDALSCDLDFYQWKAFLEQWPRKAKEFSNIFTLEFFQQVKSVFSGLKKTSYKPEVISAPDIKIPETDVELSEFCQLVLKNCTTPNTIDSGFSSPPPSRNPVSHKPMKVITENGLSIRPSAKKDF